MRRLRKHVLLPAVMPVVFFFMATSPVEVLGCTNRGLLALLIALISGLLAVGSAIALVRGRMRGDQQSFWWLINSLILAIPVVALLVMA